MATKVNISPLCAILIFAMILFSFPLSADPELRKTQIDLYGHQLAFEYQAAPLDASVKNDISALAGAFAASPETDRLIAQLGIYKRQYGMDDMASLMMLNKFTETYYKNEDAIFKTVFRYSVLLRQNIDVILGYGPGTVTLYARTNFAIDNCLYIEKAGKRYYDLSFRQNTEPHAEKEFSPQSHKARRLPLVMNMISPPAFSAKFQKKVFPFEYDGFVYFFSCNINKSLVDYYKDLPSISINTVYLNYGFASKAHQTLINELKEAVSGMPEIRAVDFLLKFSQQSIEYKKDVSEKFAFPEETMASAYADCEDKAMLFATLAKDVLGMRSVALYYKDAQHINVAVESRKKNTKGNFVFNDRQYIICEPSGKNFSPGENAVNESMASVIDW